MTMIRADDIDSTQVFVHLADVVVRNRTYDKRYDLLKCRDRVVDGHCCCAEQQ